jgi:hypothetical protein
MSDLLERIDTYLTEGKDVFAGWIAMYKGKKIEIDKSEAKDLYGAKLIALKKLNVPKKQSHMLIIKPGYEE